MSKKNYVIGVDYGTDSVRTIIVNADSGAEVASSVFLYPRWADQLYCNAAKQQFRQHPLDYIEGLQHTIHQCLLEAGQTVRDNIGAISVDTTGSTPVAVNGQGVPLSMLPDFQEDPDAMFVLWKDHSSHRQAARINEHAATFETDYLKYVGGIYSSEWFWSKLLHILHQNQRVREACASWVEHCDWIPFLLTGGNEVSKMKRSVCTAGHKALWSDEWNGLPPESFFSSLDPLLAGFRKKLFSTTWTADKPAGSLSAEWAEKLGLSTDVLVGIGAMDAHMGAVGGQIEPYFLSKVIGTSTCDMLVAPTEEVSGKLVHGICGVVEGSIIPGMTGMEAGQSAFGDVYAWFKQMLSWPFKNTAMGAGDLPKDVVNTAINNMLPELTRQAEQIPLTDQLELSVDWFNGRRTPDANPLLQGCITGLHLGTDPPALFRSLVESTCFGARAIVDRFEEQGVGVKGLIGLGGVARKSPFIMQMLADVIGMPIRINRSEQTCALGAAMFAATVCGRYSSVQEAMHAMGQGFDATYKPDPNKVTIYNSRYQQYLSAGRFAEQLSISKHSTAKITADAEF